MPGPLPTGFMEMGRQFDLEPFIRFGQDLSDMPGPLMWKKSP
jgi:hypothetical protein